MTGVSVALTFQLVLRYSLNIVSTFKPTGSFSASCASVNTSPPSSPASPASPALCLPVHCRVVPGSRSPRTADNRCSETANPGKCPAPPPRELLPTRPQVPQVPLDCACPPIRERRKQPHRAGGSRAAQLSVAEQAPAPLLGAERTIQAPEFMFTAF